MIQVVGGCYYEICLSPAIKQFYGSGGRAAALLASSGSQVGLHTFVAASAEHQARRLSVLSNFSLEKTASKQPVSFAYVSSALPPIIEPTGILNDHNERNVVVSGDKILCFGMLEGDFCVNGNLVVYDPQNSQRPKSFLSTGSTAKRLAIVCNAEEAAGLAERECANVGQSIRIKENAEVVIIKRGAAGATVYTNSVDVDIPAYYSDTIFSIGSGDIFAAAFAYAWMHMQMLPVEAANWASQSVAHYVGTRQEVFPTSEQRAAMRPIRLTKGRAYLAGPFFNMTQRWLIEQTRSVLFSAGLEVFSPLHDVGYGDADEVASADLDGLKECDRVFAILDGLDAGTLFEIGFARSMNLPVYVYAENISSENCKMIEGSGCIIVADYTTAIYHTAWKR